MKHVATRELLGTDRVGFRFSSMARWRKQSIPLPLVPSLDTQES
jgi:hypothetical protein